MFVHCVCYYSDEVREVHKGNFPYYFLALLTEAKGTSLCNQVLPYNFLRYLPLLALTGYGDVKRFEPSTDTDLVS